MRWYSDKLDSRVVQEWRSEDMRLGYLENGLTTLEIIGDGTIKANESAEGLRQQPETGWVPPLRSPGRRP